MLLPNIVLGGAQSFFGELAITINSLLAYFVEITPK